MHYHPSRPVTEGMLRDRTTYLKFDNYTSKAIKIDNGIGQGDPLSMVLYQYYNTDILEITSQPKENAIAYMDDALVMAAGADFTVTHQMLMNILTREGGVLEWSTSHNSPLKLSKLALIDFTHRCNKSERQPLALPGITIKLAEATKYLGIMVDQHLEWKAHHSYVIEKGSKWVAQIRRVTRPSWGITPKYARRLYTGVALPRILYGADIWCNPPQGDRPGPKDPGSAKVTAKITSIQRSGALAITGVLSTSPTDALDACAYLQPATHTVEKLRTRAAARLASVPPKHPLHTPVKRCWKQQVRKHRSPLHSLFKNFAHDPREVEKIPTAPRNPAHRG